MIRPRLGCEVSLAYSSLTAGSFHDECFGAGVRVAVEFDTSFRLPSAAGSAGSGYPYPESATLAGGIRRAGMGSGRSHSGSRVRPACQASRIASSLQATPYRIERDPVKRTITYRPGSYSYEKTGAAQGVLTFEGNDGKTFVFTLDVQPSGRMQVTVADADGNSPGWPGMPDTSCWRASSLPILLPIPPSWSAAIEIETDGAPEDWDGAGRPDTRPPPAQRIPIAHAVTLLLSGLLLGEVWDRAFIGADGSASSPLAWTPVYTKLGRNRAVWTISFSWCGEDLWFRATIFRRSSELWKVARGSSTSAS